MTSGLSSRTSLYGVYRGLMAISQKEWLQMRRLTKKRSITNWHQTLGENFVACKFSVAIERMAHIWLVQKIMAFISTLSLEANQSTATQLATAMWHPCSINLRVTLPIWLSKRQRNSFTVGSNFSMFFLVNKRPWSFTNEVSSSGSLYWP